MERIPGHVRNWGSRGAGGGSIWWICALCSATAGENTQCRGGAVKINGCIAGRFKKSGLDGAGE